jgi:hypothetical protein
MRRGGAGGQERSTGCYVERLVPEARASVPSASP